MPIFAESVTIDERGAVAPRFDRDPSLTDFAEPSTEEQLDSLRFFLGAQNERLVVVEDDLAKLKGSVWPEPDFDTDEWETLEAHSAVQFSPDSSRDVARVDVLRKTGEDEFELLPTSRSAGPVWAKPTPGGEASLRDITIYNTLDTDVQVRVQGWYAT